MFTTLLWLHYTNKWMLNFQSTEAWGVAGVALSAVHPLSVPVNSQSQAPFYQAAPIDCLRWRTHICIWKLKKNSEPQKINCQSIQHYNCDHNNSLHFVVLFAYPARMATPAGPSSKRAQFIGTMFEVDVFSIACLLTRLNFDLTLLIPLESTRTTTRIGLLSYLT